MKRANALLAAVVLASPASATETRPARLAITATSHDSVLVALLPRLPIHYALGLSAIDPATGDTRFNVFTGTGSVFLDSQPVRPGEGPTAESFVVDRVKPGTYVVREINQQGYWALCYHARTMKFEVGEGQVVFLGRIEAEPAVEDLEARAVAAGQTLSQGGRNFHFFDNVAPLAIQPPDANMLARLASFMASSIPGTTVQPMAATLQPASFPTGGNLTGSQRLCGGVFHKQKAADPH